jgi:hypothetical protein
VCVCFVVVVAQVAKSWEEMEPGTTANGAAGRGRRIVSARERRQLRKSENATDERVSGYRSS